MSDVVLLDPLWDTLLCVVALAMATALILFLELKRRRRFVFARVLSSIIMMLAFAGLILRPYYFRTDSQTVAILTPGYDKSDVDSLTISHPELKLMHLPGTPAYGNSTALRSIHLLDAIREQVAFVIGPGLGRAGLDILDSTKFQTIHAHLPSGIIQLNIPEEMFANRGYAFTGIINSSSANTKLVLRGPGGPEDSVAVENPGVQPFRLSFMPKQAGNFVYHLSMGDRENEIPVVVKPERSLNVLMIQDYPTFEMRHLKEFLAKKHRMVIRNQVSRNRYRYEFINRAPLTVGRVSPELLFGIDLLMIDNESLDRLSSTEKAAIGKSVRDGLGVLVTFNDNPVKVKTAASLSIDFVPYPSDTAMLSLPAFAGSLKTWSAKPRTNSLSPVIQNKNRVLSGFTSDGFGKVGFQLLVNTFELALAGDSVAFANLWTPLLEQLARREVLSSQITFQNRFPYYRNVPFEFRVTSATAPLATYNGHDVAMAEDVRIDDIWHGKIWPDRTGWNWLKVSGDSVAFYVSVDGDWHSLSMMNTIGESAQHSGDFNPRERTTSRVPVEPWIFFALFLVSAAFLWLSPKL